MKKHSEIEIVIASDVDYSKLIAEIYCEGKFVALINQELGINNLMVVFPGGETNANLVARSVDLDWLQSALVRAKNALIEVQE